MNIELLREKAREYFPFNEPRENQIEVIADILDALLNKKVKHVILSAPTGSGKSVIAWTVARVMCELFDPQDFRLSGFESWSFKSTILTANKNLQEQYLDDFSLNNLKGKLNYPCQHGTHYDSSECYVLRKTDQCSTDQCAYHAARKIWLNSQLRMTNMSFQIEACDMISTMVSNKASLMVIDECHNLGSQIQNHCAVTFDKEEFDKHKDYLSPNSVKRVHELIGKINAIIQRNTVNNVCTISKDDADSFKELMDYAEGRRKSLKPTRDQLNPKTQFMEIRKISETIAELGELSDRAEIIVRNLGQVMANDSGKLRPIFPGGFAYYALYRKSEQFLHMSATICNPESYAKEVGIWKDWVHIDMPNEIPIVNRMVMHSSVQKVGNSSLSEDMIKVVDEIIDEHEDMNGVIHTVSYDRARQILEKSKHASNMFISSNKDEIMNRMELSTGNILVSPFAFEGLDFKDDLTRFQILTKVPYENTEDLLNNLVYKMNKGLYFRRAIVKTVQACGRASRHKDDFSTTYILDSAFYDLLKYNRKVFPEWFREALIYKSKNEWKSL